MTETAEGRWLERRTDETLEVEKVLRQGGFLQADAYRYNPASIRVRVVDPRFEGLKAEQRDAMVEPYLEKLPERSQADIISLYTFAPSEIERSPAESQGLRELYLNSEFEEPSPSRL